MAFLLTIDGVSGVGKGTLSRGLAGRYNSIYLDSGAIYRAAAIYVDKKGFNLDDPAKGTLTRIVRLLKNLPVTFRQNKEGNLRVYLQNKDITEKLRLETTALVASKIAKIPEVRQALLDRQRQVLRDGRFESLIAEGRDMGTVVFPKATIKIFLTARPEVRAQRRYDELVAKGEQVDYEQILESITARDKQDTERTVAPLKPAEDAYIFDTSDLNAQEVLERTQSLIESILCTKKISRAPYDYNDPNREKYY